MRIEKVRLAWASVGNKYGWVLKRECQHEWVLEINMDEYWK